MEARTLIGYYAKDPFVCHRVARSRQFVYLYGWTKIRRGVTKNNNKLVWHTFSTFHKEKREAQYNEGFHFSHPNDSLTTRLKHNAKPFFWKPKRSPNRVKSLNLKYVWMVGKG